MVFIIYNVVDILWIKKWYPHGIIGLVKNKSSRSNHDVVLVLVVLLSRNALAGDGMISVIIVESPDIDPVHHSLSNRIEL